MINIRQSLTIGLLTFASLGLGGGPVMADTRAGGAGRTMNVPITDNVLWTTLEFKTFTLTTNSDCVAVASSDVDNADVPDSQYVFAPALNSTAPSSDDISARQLEQTTGDGDDEGFHEIGSTRFWNNITAGTHTIRWLGKQIAANDPDVFVLDSTLTLMCFDGTQL